MIDDRWGCGVRYASSMTTFQRPGRALRAAVAAAAAAAALLAACAPDALRRDPEFEAWLRGVRNECHGARIGLTSVGRLLDSAASTDGNNFLNLTSRLYAGRITEAQWRSGVTAFSSGRGDDPGLACVLERMPQR